MKNSNNKKIDKFPCWWIFSLWIQPKSAAWLSINKHNIDITILLQYAIMARPGPFFKNGTPLFAKNMQIYYQPRLIYVTALKSNRTKPFQMLKMPHIIINVYPQFNKAYTIQFNSINQNKHLNILFFMNFISARLNQIHRI